MRAGIRAIRARLTSQQKGRQAVPCRARLVGQFWKKRFQAREGFQKAPLQGGCGAKWVSLWCTVVQYLVRRRREVLKWVARQSERRIQQ